MSRKDLPPSLFHKNLVAYNTKESWRISVIPPFPQPSLANEDEVILRLLPNYAPPYSPMLFLSGKVALSVSFEDSVTDPTSEQLATLRDYGVEEGDHPTRVMRLVEGEEVFPTTFRMLWLVKGFLRELVTPSAPREWESILDAIQKDEPTLVALTQIYNRRLTVLEMGRIYTIKWARLRIKGGEEEKLKNAMALYHRVHRAYAEKGLNGAENTLKNILSDYYYVTQ